MQLADLLLGVTLGRTRAPESLGVALFLDGKEISVHGYERAQVSKGEWAIKAGTAETVVRFGPFAKAVSYDAAVLMRGNEVVLSTPFDGGTVRQAGVNDIASVPFSIDLIGEK